MIFLTSNKIKISNSNKKLAGLCYYMTKAGFKFPEIIKVTLSGWGVRSCVDLGGTSKDRKLIGADSYINGDYYLTHQCEDDSSAFVTKDCSWLYYEPVTGVQETLYNSTDGSCSGGVNSSSDLNYFVVELTMSDIKVIVEAFFKTAIDGNFRHFRQVAIFNRTIKNSTVTANNTTDIITASANTWTDGEKIRFYNPTTANLPSPIQKNKDYYVCSSSGTSFKVSDNYPTPIDILTNGSATNTITSQDDGFDAIKSGYAPDSVFGNAYYTTGTIATEIIQ